jgi:hypothetical protein
MEEINKYRIHIVMIRLENPRHKWDDGKMYRVEGRYIHDVMGVV